jgi:hypothetical protein
MNKSVFLDDMVRTSSDVPCDNVLLTIVDISRLLRYLFGRDVSSIVWQYVSGDCVQGGNNGVFDLHWPIACREFVYQWAKWFCDKPIIPLITLVSLMNQHFPMTKCSLKGSPCAIERGDSNHVGWIGALGYAGCQVESNETIFELVFWVTGHRPVLWTKEHQNFEVTKARDELFLSHKNQKFSHMYEVFELLETHLTH